MNTRHIIKEETGFKNKRVCQADRKPNGICRLLTTNKPLIQKLRSTLSYKNFQSRYFLIPRAIVQGLFLFMLRRLE